MSSKSINTGGKYPAKDSAESGTESDDDNDRLSGFLSPANMQDLSKKVSKALCMNSLTKEFIAEVVEECGQIADKYPERSLKQLNEIAFKHLTDIFAPQKKMQKARIVAENLFKYRPREVYQEPMSNTPMANVPTNSGNQTTSSAMVPVTKYSKTNFFTGHFTYNPATNVFYNSDTNAFYNPVVDWIYLPGSDTYYNASDGRRIDVSKGADIYKMFSSATTEGLPVNPINNPPNKNGGLSLSKAKMLSDIDLARENKKIISTVYNVTLDSKHRDVRAYPSASHYSIKFEKKGTESVNQVGYLNNISGTVRNVRRIDLIRGVIPNIFKPNVSIQENYMLLSLAEISGQHYNSSPLSKSIFGRLQFDLRLPINTDFMHVEPIECYRTYSPEPLTIPIVALTVSLLNNNGSQYDFGTDLFTLRYWQSLGAITVITTWLPHGLASGERVLFRFTNNPKLDESIDGFIIMVIAPTVFTVVVDSTTVSAGIAPNIGGPPIDPLNPAGSAGHPFPTVPPNDPANPTDKYGYILDLKKQNALTFKITSEEKMDVSQDVYASTLKY